ncbi:MAG: hypothetical protein ACI92G_002981 [Candidatus Pelagisphaera sp.]|jgi:hypothetical protein
MKRYAIIGTGARATMYRDALTTTYADRCSLKALCDKNPLRMAAFQSDPGKPLPEYGPDDLEKMIREQAIDEVIVTTMDSTHHHFICRAMDAGCDVITEKPMTIDPDKCQQILAAIDRSGRNLRVTFNYRYAPRNSKVKEVLQSGAIGEVVSVHFEWLLDTKHGADYFRRWHRDKKNSGGLMVHKSTHHFDLVNWWLSSIPETVFALGGLRFYGAENAARRGEPRSYLRSTGAPEAADDPFALDLSKDPELKKLYLDCESADGYHRDQNVFGQGISIEDDIAVSVRYKNQATLSYHLSAYSPWEGYRVAFNGTKGRLELSVVESAYVSGKSDDPNFSKNVKGASDHAVEEPTSLTLQVHWGKPQILDIDQKNAGGHGGADTIMLRDLFAPEQIDDPLGRAAGHTDGAFSILTGIAANQSMRTGQAVSVPTLIPSLFD